jgi:site-specific recombinase XerD
MTRRLRNALLDFRPDRKGERVLYGERGHSATAKNVAVWLIRAQRKAGLKTRKGAHTLRHTFCSHLAMRGAPPRAIQELAGHRNITTTERYMHLSPAALDGAIRLLEQGHDDPEEGA